MGNKTWKPGRTFILRGIYLLVGLLFAWTFRAPIIELLALIGDREAIVLYLQGYGVLGPLFLSIVLLLQVFLAMIPGHAFMVAGGYVYGFALGALITQISTVIASQLAYLLARRAGRPLVCRLAPTNVIDRWNKVAERQGMLFFFFSFVLPIFPNDLMCFVAGLSSISSRRFFIANFLGRLPCAVFITLIGSHGLEMPLQYWIVILVGLAGLFIAWRVLSGRVEQRYLQKLDPVGC